MTNPLRRWWCGVVVPLALLAPSLASARQVPVASSSQLASANSSASPGDTITLAPGTYTTAISPARSGTSSDPIVYRGPMSNPDAVTVPEFTIGNSGNAVHRDYVIVQHMTVNGAANVWESRGVVFRKLKMITPRISRQGSFHCRMDSCSTTLHYSGTYTTLNVYGSFHSTYPTWYDTLSNNTLLFNTGTSTSGYDNFIPHVSFTENVSDANQWVKYCLWNNNTISTTLRPGTATNIEGPGFYANQYCTFRNNHWIIADSTADEPRWALRIRSGTQHNTFDGDIFEVTTGAVSYSLSSESPTGYTGPGEYRLGQGYNRWYRCTFKVNQTKPGRTSSPIEFQWGANGDTLEQCVLVSNFLQAPYGCLHTGQIQAYGLMLKNNTIAALKGGTALSLDPVDGSFTCWQGPVYMRNNIFYSPTTSASYSALHVAPWAGKVFDSDYNFYTYWGASSGARSVRYRDPSCPSSSTCGSCTGGSYSTSVPGSSGKICGALGVDCHSTYGTPAFLDSTFASFDPRLGSGSQARGVGMGGVDAGAIVAADVTPPPTIAQIDTSHVGDRSLTLSWTAPSDGGGAVAAYDLRWSTQPIDGSNFGAATPVSPQPTPLPPGSVQSYVASGLAPGTDYYFAIRSRDGSGNWSGVSPAVHARTALNDQIAPAAVKDLATQ
jgi:hypothetical protein